MKIVSKFKDYYDSAQAFGHDDARLYRRESSALTIPENVWPYGNEVLATLDKGVPDGNSSDLHDLALLLFCGRAWPMWYPHPPYRSWYGEGPGREDPQEVQRTMKLYPEWHLYYSSLLSSSQPEEREQAKLYFARREPSKWQRYLLVGDDLMRKAHETLAGSEVGEQVLVGLGVPCVLLINRTRYRQGNGSLLIITNPRLVGLGFQRIMDPYACYQAIETFLGSQLAPPDIAPQSVGGDRVLAQQKGFDEGSFRTAAPGAKKTQRAANRARKRGE